MARPGRLRAWRRAAAWACAGLISTTGAARAEDHLAELRAQVEEQSKALAVLREQIDQRAASKTPAATDPADPPKLDDGAVKRIIGQYLQDNPGAGMPPGVQTGYSPSGGFGMRSTPNPSYVNWEDECKIPFELRIRGRVQLVYDMYKVTDTHNHLTGLPVAQLADFSQLEAKRVQLTFEGTLFDPNLRYHMRLHGDTRGLPAIQSNGVIQSAGAADPAGFSSTTAGVQGITVDHSVRLFECWVAYDYHPCGISKGCGPDCPPGSAVYGPTVTLIAGKLKPFFGLEEYLNNAVEQFVEFPMSDLYFSADDDNRLMAAGVQVKALEDRFYTQAVITNGSESLFSNSQMDHLPGFVAGWWYDLGGSWNEQRKAWDLFGDSISDIDYSCQPVARVGSSMDIVPLDRRSQYGDTEQSRYFVMPAGPRGTRIINLLNGDGAAASPAGSHAVDDFDVYELNAFAAAKYHGFSILNEWWVRDINNFHSAPAGRNQIVYQDSLGNNALFPNHALVDYGMNLATGYFVIPKKLEVAARWAWVRGESGNINGNGNFSKTTIPTAGAPLPVRVYQDAFRHYSEADEYTIGLNYYFRRQQVKWQTDVGYYRGGNPAAGGTSITGYVAGADGYLLRTQIQLFF